MAEEKRPYQMRARAEAAAATHRRILDAATELTAERFLDEITLEAIADRAGVTVQTVIRRFQTKQLVLLAAAADAAQRVNAQRDEAPVGDVEGAVRNLIEHYEQWGPGVLRTLSQEDRDPAIRAMTDYGRVLHRRWVERVFAPALEHRTGAARERLVAQLVAICDVYTWKLLRRDRGLSREQTELALTELLNALLEDP